MNDQQLGPYRIVSKLEISPEVATAELSVTATQVFFTMRSTSGSIWMLDNVDK